MIVVIPGVVRLDDLQRAEDPVLDGLVLEFVGVLDIDVDVLQPVRVDHLLVRGGQRLGGLTVRAELVAAPAAERDLHVAALAADFVDRLLVHSAGQRPVAVPRG
ncbi:MAG: hypothetical protein ACRDT4_02575 [Micromonosporaceae bacterium]